MVGRFTFYEIHFQQDADETALAAVENPYPNTIHDHYKQGKAKGYGGVCYIGCNANELNARASNGIPVENQREYPPDSRIYLETCEDYQSAYDKRLAEAEAEAKSWCESKKDCPEWAIKLELTEDVYEYDGSKKVPCASLNGNNGKIVKSGKCPQK